VAILDEKVLSTMRSIVFAEEREGWAMVIHHDKMAPEWFSSLVHTLVASLVSFGDQASTTVYNVHDIKFALALVAEKLTASR
jgi:hypothetical protein